MALRMETRHRLIAEVVDNANLAKPLETLALEAVYEIRIV
jgi:hypothetical protein